MLTRLRVRFLYLQFTNKFVSLQDTMSLKISIILTMFSHFQKAWIICACSHEFAIDTDTYWFDEDNNNRFCQFRNKKLGCLIRFLLNEIIIFTSNSIKVDIFIYFEPILYFANCQYTFFNQFMT